MYFYRRPGIDSSRGNPRIASEIIVLTAFVLLLAPLALMVAAYVSFQGPGFRPRATLKTVQIAALASMAASILAGVVLILTGPATSFTIGLFGLGLSFRLDALSAIMQALVAFVGWVVLRYAATYLDGEERQGPFMGWMCMTLSAVLLLVAAGNLVLLVLAWIATSLGIHQLLLFYAERPQAQRAARKKAVTARAGDVALIAAAVLLIWSFGTGDIATILSKASGGGGAMVGAAGLLAIAALLKSAQFPTHGWLTEVMETPTPVSALLHAGVINAGGFLLIRFADVMVASPAILAVVAIAGGFTALFAGLVMLTQPAIKTSLAWSTIGQMGFMLLQCGLALFPLALLHIVAHSLYKAHAFLASGGAVEQVASIQRPGPVSVPSGGAVIKAFGVALAIYIGIGLAFGFADKSPQAIALGAILIFGVAYLIAQGLADTAPNALTQRTAFASVAAAVSYFAYQTLADWLMAGTLPPTPQPGPLEWALLILSVVSFALVAVAQALFPLWAYHPAAAGLRVHLANGFYANAIFDRLMGGWSAQKKI
jgi:NAD(P)H-quinone oxidoreductase subunit 5